VDFSAGEAFRKCVKGAVGRAEMNDLLTPVLMSRRLKIRAALREEGGKLVASTVARLRTSVRSSWDLQITS